MRVLLVYNPDTSVDEVDRAIDYLGLHHIDYFYLVQDDIVSRLSSLKEVDGIYLFGDLDDWPETSLWLQLTKFADKILIRKR